MNHKQPTKVFQDALTGGRTVIPTLPGAMPAHHGVLPLVVDGKLSGEIGGSAASAERPHASRLP
jgi:hypothetical protein